MQWPTILLADDHTLEALQQFLEPEFKVVTSASDGQTFLNVASELKPDVIVLDVGLRLPNGMEAGSELRRILPQTKLIVLTMTRDIGREAVRSWASGYLLKTAASSALIKAIRRVLQVRSYVTPNLARRPQDELGRNPRRGLRRVLTARQRDVLRLLAEGRTMREAAEILDITPRTIAFHKYRIMQEFELKNNLDLIRFAIRERVISVFQPPAQE
jgi:DNA-binding NarL/FixJ family response regulator